MTTAVMEAPKTSERSIVPDSPTQSTAAAETTWQHQGEAQPFWDAYLESRGEAERWALVELYLIEVQDASVRFARSNDLSKDEARVESQDILFESLIPSFKGEGAFLNYARKGLRNELRKRRGEFHTQPQHRRTLAKQPDRFAGTLGARSRNRKAQNLPSVPLESLYSERSDGRKSFSTRVIQREPVVYAGGTDVVPVYGPPRLREFLIYGLSEDEWTERQRLSDERGTYSKLCADLIRALVRQNQDESELIGLARAVLSGIPAVIGEYSPCGVEYLDALESDELSNRQREVFMRRSRNESNKAIGRALNISDKTVESEYRNAVAVISELLPEIGNEQ